MLSELEVACLMRVLSKPEIDHAILLNELNLVLENFGIAKQEGAADSLDPEQLREEAEKKKQKQTKKKQIKAFVQSSESQEAQDTYYMLLAILQTFQFEIEHFMELLATHKYE